MNSAAAPLVSVIIPVYNVERYLDECLNSVRGQTYRHLEILLIEDCSTDGSLQALGRHLADPRVHLLRHEYNAGLSASRNTGIDAATGAYIMFVDSDDIVDVRLVEACVICSAETGAEIVTYGFTPFDDGSIMNRPLASKANHPNSVEIDDAEYFSLPHFAWLKFIREDLLRLDSMRFPEGKYYEDWPFHWRLGFSAKTKYQLAEIYYLYRQRPTSITGTNDHKLLDLFFVQAQVMNIVGAAGSPECCKLLANKVRDSHWSILTSINDDLLSVALERARRSDKALRAKGFSAKAALRRRVITVIVRLPGFSAIMALRLLRATLRAYRRDSGRQSMSSNTH